MSLTWIIFSCVAALVLLAGLVLLVVFLTKQRHVVATKPAYGDYAQTHEQEKLVLGFKIRDLAERQKVVDQAKAATAGAIGAVETDEVNRLATRLEAAGALPPRPTSTKSTL